MTAANEQVSKRQDWDPSAAIDNNAEAVISTQDIALPVGQVALSDTRAFSADAITFQPDDVLDNKELRNTQIYAKNVLGRPLDASEASQFRVFMKQFGFPLYRVSRSTTPHNTAEQRLFEAARYLQGRSNVEIQIEVGAKSPVTVGVSRVLSIQKVMQRYCGPEQLDGFFDVFKNGDELPDVHTVVPVEHVRRLEKALAASALTEQSTASEEREDNRPKTPPKAYEPAVEYQEFKRRDERELERRLVVSESLERVDWEEVTSRCANYWGERYLEGLDDALAGRLTHIAKEVKNHLAGLLAVYAPELPGHGSNEADVLNRLEWQVIAEWTNYRKPKDDQEQNLEDVGTGLFLGLQHAGKEVGDVAGSGISKLVHRARKDYAANIFPRALAGKLNESQPTGTNAQHERLNAEVKGLINEILNGNHTYFEDASIVTISDHLSGLPVDTESPRFYNAGAKLREYVEFALRVTKFRATNGASDGAAVSSQDAGFVCALLPGQQLIAAKFSSLDELVNNTNAHRKMGEPMIDPNQAKLKILTILTSVHNISKRT